MPKIPQYNQGLGPSVQLATGQLSPRANVGAFTAPGQAVAQFGQKAQNIAFEFGMQERNREDRTAIQEATREANDFFGTRLIEDQSRSTEEAAENFKAYREEFMQGLQSRGLSSRRFELVSSAVDNVFSQKALAGKQQAFNRGTKAATDADNDALDTALESLRTYPQGSFQHDAALEYANSTFNIAETENRKLKYDRGSFSLQTKVDRANIGFESATTPAEADAAYQALKDDPTIPPAKLLEAKKVRDATKTKLGTAMFDDTLEVITEGAFSSNELNQIAEGYKTGEDFTVTRPDGQEVQFSVANMPITRRRQIVKIAEDAAGEFNAETRAGIISDMNDAYETAGQDGVLAIATVAVIDAEDKGEADAAILGAARGYDAQAQIAYANGDYETALEFSQLAESLVTSSFSNRPSLSENAGSVGQSSNVILKSVAATRTDIAEKRQDEAIISGSAESMLAGNYIDGLITKPQEKAALDKAISGKSLPDQLQILERNNLTYAPMASILGGAASDGLGIISEGGMTPILEGVELYRQMTLFGKQVINNHTTDDERAFFKSVLALESIGMETEDAIRKVNFGFNSGIDIAPKYATIKSSVDQILSSNQTTFFGITLSGQSVNNRPYVHQKVEDLAKLYISMGTLKAEDAAALAVEHVNESHINLRGQLIPRRKNYPPTISRMADLAAEDFVARNPEYDVNDVALIPFGTRQDEWIIVANGVMASNAKDPLYKMEDLNGLMAGDRATTVDAIIQENLENRGLTEPQQLRSKAQELRREANKLTGGNLSKIRKDQGEEAAQAAIAKREALLDEADNITKLLQEQERLARGR